MEPNQPSRILRFGVFEVNLDARQLRKHGMRIKLQDQPFDVLDLKDDAGPILIHTQVPSATFVDVITDVGCVAAGFSKSYPQRSNGRAITWDECQPVGQLAWDGGEAGIACRSATAVGPPSRNTEDPHELAWFQRQQRLHTAGSQSFDAWFFDP